MICQRIYTEDKDQKEISRLAGTFFDSFTVYNSTGSYKGILERSLIIEVISRYPKRNIYRLAHKIKEFNRQQSVLVTSHDIQGEII